jgi:drug/metabolite transporter (DMT)-like permease
LAKREGGRRPGLRLLLLMGCLQFAGSYAIVYWAQSILPSGLTAVLWAVYPLLLGAVGHVVLPGERMRGRQWLGMAFGFCGIACLFWTDLRAAGPKHVGAGAVLMVSPIIVAICNALVRRHGSEVSSILLNRDGMLLGAVLLGLLALSTEREATPQWTGTAVFSVAYLGLAGTCLTFSIYFWLLRHIPAYQLALTAYITPLVALTLGTLLGGERYTLQTALGTGLVLAGVAVVRRGRRR